MAKTTCKLCTRRFASPRALAGHMRAHSIAAAKSQISSASSASTSIVAGGDDDADARKGYVLREKPKRRVRLAEPDFSDRESETTAGFPPPSPPTPSAKYAANGSGDVEPPVSSVSDGATPEEDVALWLMMLSRDTWPSPPPAYYRAVDSDDEEGGAARPIAQKRTRYECPACKKAFRSYQALGGHRASNVRGGKGGCCAPPLLSTPPPSPTQHQPLQAYDAGREGAWKLQPHQCPLCFRVFSSGQALGGHRRSHLCSAAIAAAVDAPIADPPVAMKTLGFIDLNQPATSDDVDLSVVSDPFLSSKPGS